MEVWRKSLGQPPIAAERDDVAALITDDPIEVDVPVWPKAEMTRLTDRILDLVMGAVLA